MLEEKGKVKGQEDKDLSSDLIKIHLSGPSDLEIERLRRYEIEHPVDEDGTAELYVRPSNTPGGGLGCFSRGKPRPYEYLRDKGDSREGFLTNKESDESWAARDSWAEYTMQVTLGANWFRDDFAHGGRLQPMQDLHEYVRAGRIRQKLKWDSKNCQYDFADYDDGVIYRALMDQALNPVPYCNDAAFGMADGESDMYDKLDEKNNPLIMIPCLTRVKGGGNMAELSSVWFYPRAGWEWKQGDEQEVTIGYHWPLETWMMRAKGESVGLLGNGGL